MSDGGRGEGPLGWEPEEPEAGECEDRWAHRIDPDHAADLEGRPRPPGEGGENPPEPTVGRLGSPYSAVVGALFILALVAAGVNTLNNLGGSDSGVVGLSRERDVGEVLLEFAVPDIRGSLDGDANIAQTDCEVRQRPCPASNRRRSACEVRARGAIRVCDYFDRPFVLSFWFTRGGDCDVQQDVVEAAYRRYGRRVGFLSLNVRDARGLVERTVRRRHWRIPVGHDRDGGVSNVYRVGGCPTVLLARPGGILEDTMVGRLDRGRLDRKIRRLLERS